MTRNLQKTEQSRGSSLKKKRKETEKPSTLERVEKRNLQLILFVQDSVETFHIQTQRMISQYERRCCFADNIPVTK